MLPRTRLSQADSDDDDERQRMLPSGSGRSSGGSFARERPRGGLVMVHALPTVQAQEVLPVAVAAEDSSVTPVVPSSSTSGTSSATAKGVIVGTDYR